jgi:hypothetical protein
MHAIDVLLSRLQHWTRSQPILYRLTLGTRLLLAAAFIPTGMVKLLGYRFTTMDPATPLGGFFETLYRSGPYWHFLGASQILAGVLILNAATATLGAVIFAPIILNIFVITLSYDFRGTPVIAGLMVLATLYLLAWDYDRLRGILGLDARESPLGSPLPQPALSGPAERAVYVVGAVAGLGLFTGLRGLFFSGTWNVLFLAVSLASALGAAWLGLAHRRSPVHPSSSIP